MDTTSGADEQAERHDRADLRERRAAVRQNIRGWLGALVVVTLLAAGWGAVSGRTAAAATGVVVGTAMSAFLGWALWQVRDRP